MQAQPEPGHRRLWGANPTSPDWRHHRRIASTMLIDRYHRRFDVTYVRKTSVDAAPDDAYAAAPKAERQTVRGSSGDEGCVKISS